MKKFTLMMWLLAAVLSIKAQVVSTFEELPLEADSYWNGSDGSGKFISGKVTFFNDYNATWGVWSGFAYSSKTDRLTPGMGNQYSAVTGAGVFGSANYAVGYDFGNLKAQLDAVDSVSGFYLTNNAYAYYAMRDGDFYSKKFGGISGTDPDWFRLNIYGLATNGDTTGVVVFYLADFRSDNPAEDYILDSWKWVDLTSLGKIKELRFTLESSDAGAWGINTPGYFCLDNLNYRDKAPEVALPVADMVLSKNSTETVRIPLAPVFKDDDSPGLPMTYQVERLENDQVVEVSVYSYQGDGGSILYYLDLNVIPNTAGVCRVTISATCNGKKTEHTFTVEVRVPTGVESVLAQKVSVFPNPFSQSFYLQFTTDVERIILRDLQGRLLWQQTNLSGQQFQVDALANCPSGIYLLTVIGADFSYSQPVVKK